MSSPPSNPALMNTTPPGPVTPAVSRRRRKRFLLATLIGLVVAPILAEAAFRVWLRVDGRPYDAESLRTTLLEHQSRARDFVPRPAMVATNDAQTDNAAQQRIVHPYMGWEVSASVEQIEAEMQRIGDPAAANDYEILLVGGSVADVFGAYGADRLQERLEADPHLGGRRVYVYKYARGGYKHPQTLNAVQYMLSLGFEPECVLAIDGFNEVALSNENAVQESNPILPSTMHWGALAMNGVVDRECVAMAGRMVENLDELVRFTGKVVSSGAWRSAIVGTLAERRMLAIEDDTRRLRAAYYERMRTLGGEQVMHGPPFRGRGLPAIEDGIRAWTEGSRSLRALCEARGIRYVHVLQPTLHDEGSKPVTDEERAKGVIGESWLEAVKIGYPLLRAAGEKLSRNGEQFFDATRIFAGNAETLYYDNCHFGAAGNRIFADWIAETMLSRW